MTEAVPADAFLACARAGLCHVKGMIAFLRGTVAESYPQRLILDVHGVCLLYTSDAADEL